MDQVRLTLFGSPRVERDGARLQFDTRKAMALLAFLAVTRRPQRRDTLAALLWPESDHVRARSSLRRTLSVASTVGSALVTEREEIALRLPAEGCDVDEFEHLLRDDEPASWRNAVELARDDFMAGFSLRDSPAFDDWQRSTAARNRDLLVRTLSKLVDVDVARGRDESALALARRWVATDPLSETAHGHLMRLLTWTGQRPLAIQQYRTLVRTLDSELGVDPLPQTTDLYDDIRGNRLTRSDVTADDQAHVPTLSVRTAAVDVPVTPIIGRAAERRRLLAAWRSSHTSTGLMGLIGEPGLGRSTLATDLADEVEREGGAVAVIRAHENESELPFAASRDLIRALGHQLPNADHLDEHVRGELARLDPSDMPHHIATGSLNSSGALLRMFDAVRQLTEASLIGEQPGLLIIDDAQWLDPSSSDLIAYTVRRLSPGVLVLVTWRAGSHPCGVTELVIGSGEIVALSSLTADQVRELLEAVPDDEVDYREVHQRTGGVPRLVVEHLAATRTGQVAGPMRGLVLARLESASATTRQLAGAAAVLGGVVDVDVLRATAGRPESETVDALEEAVQRGLLVEVPNRNGYDFPHDLLRDLVLERTSIARQRVLHGRAADALMRRHSASPSAWPAAVVAGHLAAAGRQDQAASWYWTAACEARALYAHQEELKLLRSAQGAGFESTAVHTAIGDCLTRLGRYRESLLTYEQAAASAADDDAVANVEHKLAIVHDRLGDWPVAQTHLESARDLLAGTAASALRARVTADLALVLHRQGHDHRAISEAQRGLTDAEATSDSLARAQAHNVLGVLATGRGDFALAITHLEQSRELAADLDDIGPTVAAANNAARAHELAGHHDEARAAAQDALAAGIRHGDRHRIAALHTNLADLLHRHGQDVEAKEHARAAAEAFADVDDAGFRPQVWTLVEW